MYNYLKCTVDKVIPNSYVDFLEKNFWVLTVFFLTSRLLTDFRLIGNISLIFKLVYYFAFVNLLIYVIKKICRNDINKLEKLNILYAIFLLVFLIVGFWKIGSILELTFNYIKIISYLVCFSVGVILSKNKLNNKLIRLINVFFILSTIVAGIQVIFSNIAFSEDGNMRIDSLFGHPNAYADMLLIFLSIYLMLYIERRRKVYLINGLLILFLAFKTESRTAILAIVFVIIFSLIFSIKLKKSSIYMFIITTLSILLINIKSLLERFNLKLWISQISNSISGEIEVVDSSSFRLANWMNLLKKLKGNIFFGNGLGTTKYINDFRVGYEAHNDYIKYIIETGVLGFIGIIAYHIFFAIELIRKTFFKSGRVIFGIFLAVNIFKFLDGLEQATTFMNFYYLTLGLVYASGGKLINDEEKNRVKVMQLIVSGYSEYGGGENIVEKISGNIDTNDFTPYVLTNSKVLYEKLKLKNKYFVNVDPNSKIDILKLTLSLLVICFKEKIDVINSHHRFSTVSAGLIKYITNVKLIHTVHYFSYDGRWANWLCNNYITVSKQLQDHYINYYKVSENKIDIICNGVKFPPLIDEEKKSYFDKCFNRENDEVLLGCVGRLTEVKGHKYLIDAMNLIKDHKVRLFIAGDGVLKKELEEQIQKLGLKEKVILIGYTEKINEFMKSVDIIIMPSLSEGFPFTILEALSNGKYVIATNVTGNNEIINDNALGCLVKSKNSNELKNAIIEAIELEKYKKFNDIREEEVRVKYTLEKNIKALERIYRNI